MKLIEVTEAATLLAQYVQSQEPVILTQNGRVVAVLMPIEEEDVESISLSLNPKFTEIIKRSRDRQKTEGGLSLEEVRQQLGL